jgi:DNA-binding NarL/FixJ family response regulator
LAGVISQGESVLKNVLIVAKTGQLRDGLHALLETLPCVGLVSITDTFTSGLEYLSERCPALVLLVADSHKQDIKSIKKMVDICPQMHFLALVTNEEHRQTIAAWNVHATLLSGVTASELSTTIEALLLGNC